MNFDDPADTAASGRLLDSMTNAEGNVVMRDDMPAASGALTKAIDRRDKGATRPMDFDAQPEPARHAEPAEEITATTHPYEAWRDHEHNKLRTEYPDADESDIRDLSDYNHSHQQWMQLNHEAMLHDKPVSAHYLNAHHDALKKQSGAQGVQFFHNDLSKFRHSVPANYVSPSALSKAVTEDAAQRVRDLLLNTPPSIQEVYDNSSAHWILPNGQATQDIGHHGNHAKAVLKQMGKHGFDKDVKPHIHIMRESGAVRLRIHERPGRESDIGVESVGPITSAQRETISQVGDPRQVHYDAVDKHSGRLLHYAQGMHRIPEVEAAAFGGISKATQTVGKQDTYHWCNRCNKASHWDGEDCPLCGAALEQGERLLSPRKCPAGHIFDAHGSDEGDPEECPKCGKKGKHLQTMMKAHAYVAFVQRARLGTNPEPTLAQKEAGNYAKGTVKIHGLTIRIENPKGSWRRGVSPTGHRWKVKMQNDYGYFTRNHGSDTTPMGIDGDPVDVFIGPHPQSELAFIVDQCNGDGEFDEHKCVLGATTEDEARAVYLANYSAGWKCGKITALTMADFKSWLKNHPKEKPCSELGFKKL